VDPAADRRGGLAGWRTPRGTPGTKLTEALHRLRDDESDR
jgi:hypothetical protein